MPLTKELKRRGGVIYVTDIPTGKLMLAVSESLGLDNPGVMKLLRSISSKHKAKPPNPAADRAASAAPDQRVVGHSEGGIHG